MTRTYLIAEIGCNHNGSCETAREMVKRASECGVDAVKFQMFDAESLVTRNARKADYQLNADGSAGSQFEMLRGLQLSKEEYADLCGYSRRLGLDVFSTAFDLNSALMLAEMGQKTWKIPSGEITNLPLLRLLGSLGATADRVIVSTGMATIDEIRSCLEVLSSEGTDLERVTLLHCNTEYPTPDQDVNLTAIMALKSHFPETGVGLSDHSVGSVAAVGAVALGAVMVEKHFTLDKDLPGPDHKASSTPKELTELCNNVRRLENMLGYGEKFVTKSEAKNKSAARKSIVASMRIEKGDCFSADNLTCKRPGLGISPMCWDDVCGRTAERSFDVDDLIELSGFDWQCDQI